MLKRTCDCCGFDSYLLSILFAALFFSVSVSAQEVRRAVTFTPAAQEVINPERGFWRVIDKNFAAITPADIENFRSDGISTAYAIVRLDSFRGGDISDAFLRQLDHAFEIARQAGLKLILRCAYNYPKTHEQYLHAKDAPLPIVKHHIAQLAPVIARNRNVIAVMQAGFIGAWGEGHSSSNHLDTPANKRAVISTLLARMPNDLQILWRAPQDVFKWREEQLLDIERVGLHNDCFLASLTDVGTYSEDPHIRAIERRKAAAISARTYYTGETCRTDAASMRMDCGSILREGAMFHFASLNGGYYEGFMQSWKRNGCYSEVQRSLGYRLKLVSATIDAANTFSVTVENEGWSRPLVPRSLYVIWRDASNLQHQTLLGPGSVNAIAPHARVTFSAKLGNAASNFCLAAPDTDSVLVGDPRYAIRFACAGNPAKGQFWNARLGRFCFKL